MVCGVCSVYVCGVSVCMCECVGECMHKCLTPPFFKRVILHYKFCKNYEGNMVCFITIVLLYKVLFDNIIEYFTSVPLYVKYNVVLVLQCYNCVCLFLFLHLLQYSDWKCKKKQV